MKLSFRLVGGAAGLVAAAVLVGACRTAPGDPNSHWNVDSVPQRVTKHFTGYRGALDGSYWDYQLAKKGEINLTFRRHFLNNNPLNPFQVEDPSITQRRPPFGIQADIVNFFHLDALAWGLFFQAYTGTFIPIPVDSLLGLMQSASWSRAGWRPSGGLPPSPETFQVKNG